MPKRHSEPITLTLDGIPVTTATLGDTLPITLTFADGTINTTGKIVGLRERWDSDIEATLRLEITIEVDDDAQP